MMQSPNTGVGKGRKDVAFSKSVLVDVYEAYRPDSQECIAARTKSLAKRYATQLFGGFDLVSKATIRISESDAEEIKNDGFII